MKIAGVDELFLENLPPQNRIDQLTDSVLEHLDEEELKDAIRGEQDSLAAAEEAFGRINP